MKHAGKMSRRSILAAGALLAALGVIGIIPWRVIAQERGQTEKQKAERAGGGGDYLFSGWLIERLELSEAQMRRIRSLDESSKRQIRRILTLDQQKSLDVLVERRENPGIGVELTAEQRAKLDALKRQMQAEMRSLEHNPAASGAENEERGRAIKQKYEAQFKQILTPEQIKKIESRRESDENRLGITDEQKEKLQALEREEKEARETIGRDSSLSNEEKEARVRDLIHAVKEGAHQILTPEQLKRADEEHAATGSSPYSLSNLERLGTLTTAQKRQIEAVYRNAERQLQQVLNPAQRQRMKELREQR